LLNEKGIRPDAIICRSKMALPLKIKEKIALFCDMDTASIITGIDTSIIYEIPLIFKKEGILKILKEKLDIKDEGSMAKWESLVDNIRTPQKEVTVAICGKYTQLKDSYASIIEALTHAGAHIASKVNLRWIETTDIEDGKLSAETALSGVNGVLVPGGFGLRGTEGKIALIQYARENKIPYLGICYGLQLAVIEFARNVCGLANASSAEINPACTHPVIDLLPEQKGIDQKGGTMRLGASKNNILSGTLASELYQKPECSERHRHRYEVNPEYHEHLQSAGLVFGATSRNGLIVEFIELQNHPFFFATQAHNELTSRLESPNPAFSGFVHACVKSPPARGRSIQTEPPETDE